MGWHFQKVTRNEGKRSDVRHSYPVTAPLRRIFGRIDGLLTYTYDVCMQDRVDKKKQRMVRKQFFITADQNRRLKELAAITGKSEAELVRDVVDRRLDEEQQGADDWKAAWRQAAGMWKDRTDLDQFYSDLRAARKRRRERSNETDES